MWGILRALLRAMLTPACVARRVRVRARALLTASRRCGNVYAPQGEFLVMAPEKVSVPVLNAAGAELNSALSNPFFGVL